MGSMTKARAGLTAAVAVVAALLLGASPAAAGQPISGVVTDGADQPLAGIEVCAISTGPLGEQGCDRTDAGGAYEIAGFGAGYLVRFSQPENAAPGYAPQWYPGVPDISEAEPAPSGSGLSEVDATMELGATVSGQVKSIGTEAPIEDVEVCPQPVVFSEYSVFYCTHTDAMGDYALRSLLPGSEYRIEFRSSRNVNYVEYVTGAIGLSGSGLHLDAFLVPGVEVKGTLTEAGTGDPVHGMQPEPPYTVPRVCALDSASEAVVKCGFPALDGSYAIPGLPPGRSYAIAFALDLIEEGVDIHPDGYVRQYWHGVPSFDEAIPIAGSGGSVFEGIDAVLSPGAEVFPHCEVTNLCPPASQAPVGNSTVEVIQSPLPALALPSPPPIVCRKGFRHVFERGRSRCVRVVKPRRHRHHRRHKPRHPARHTSAERR
jgi:hypothetical protein